MRIHKPFGRVYLVWGRWWAVQLYLYECLSLGFHIDPRRPLLDLHLGPVTVALGRCAHCTDMKDMHRHSCRGFLRADDPAGLL